MAKEENSSIQWNALAVGIRQEDNSMLIEVVFSSAYEAAIACTDFSDQVDREGVVCLTMLLDPESRRDVL